MPLIVEHCLIHPYLSVCGCVSASSFRTTMCLLKGIVMPLFVEHCMIHLSVCVWLRVRLQLPHHAVPAQRNFRAAICRALHD